jgi:hypothetical protein
VALVEHSKAKEVLTSSTVFVDLEVMINIFSILNLEYYKDNLALLV